MKKFIITSCMLLTSIFAISGEIYSIKRISAESVVQAMDKDASDAQHRFVKKMAIVAGVAATVYGVVQLQRYFSSGGVVLQDGKENFLNENYALIDTRKWISKSSLEQVQALSWSFENLPSIFAQGVYNTGQSIVDTSVGASKWIVGAASAFIGMGALNVGAQQIGANWSYFHESEELSGFIMHQTHLWKYATLMKEFAVPFDIYSTRLSADLNFGQQRIVLSEFMKDMMDAAESSNEWTKNRLLMAMKKDYLQKTSSLHELQDHALHAMNYRQRIESGLVNSLLEIEEFNRSNVAEFCNLLISEVERVAAFIKNKSVHSYMPHYFEHGVETLVHTTNIFAVQVEQKLSLPMADLYQQSKQGDGLFDLIFDYVSFLQQHVEATAVRLQYSK